MSHITDTAGQDAAPAPLPPEERERIAALIGDAKPATDRLLMSFGESVRDRREHEHPTWEDLYCANLAAYMGERMGPVLRRLLDAEAEVVRVRAELDAARNDREHVARAAALRVERLEQERNEAVVTVAEQAQRLITREREHNADREELERLRAQLGERKPQPCPGGGRTVERWYERGLFDGRRQGEDPGPWREGETALCRDCGQDVEVLHFHTGERSAGRQYVGRLIAHNRP